MKYLFLLLLLASFNAHSQTPKEKMLEGVSKKEMYYGGIAKQIWTFAEVSFQEAKSSNLLQDILRKEGFKIESRVAGIPTAFVATFGDGKPIISILGEYDALPGLSQDSTTEKKSVSGIAGHACGHHLFGVGSVAAVIAVKEYMKTNNIKGTLRFYGTPAEEDGDGKVYLVRAGLFNDVDVVLHWHPWSQNHANPYNTLAYKAVKFRFYGIASHASAAPESGRSALDAVEAMDYMVNMMREHVPPETRIHYVITNGGKAPNVVPDFAEVYYYYRHPRREILMDIADRIEKAAQGAALGTGTKVEMETVGGTYELLPNETLAKVMHKNLSTVGGVKYSTEEKLFAEKISKTLLIAAIKYEDAEIIQPITLGTFGGGSTDVGDISWVVPTVAVRTATWVPGTPAHSWQAVAAGGMSIGRKGMINAAKTLALTAIDLFENPQLIKDATAEFEKARGGKDYQYKSLLGDRKPPLEQEKIN